MIRQQSAFAALAAVATLALAACGGSSGGGNGGTAGIDGTGAPSPGVVSLGTISAFGSIVVNGVRFDTSTAVFTVDDSPGSQSDLAVGDVVLVRGTVAAGGATGVATAVIFDDQVQGPISAIDAAASTFTVLGQTVRVAADTSFDDRIQPASFAGLTIGAVVEISGLPEADGSIRATRIEPKAAGTQPEITGIVSNHDSAARRFSINAQVIDYSATAQLRDFPGGVIANGQTVEVKAGSLSGSTWRPESIEWQANNLAGTAGDRREVEGFISRFASATDFSVAGVLVTTNAQTVFTGGTAANLGLNVEVEVEGALNASGVLLATKVDIRRSSALRVAARVDSVNSAAGSFVVLGITVRVDALTRIEDKSSQQTRPFGLANLFVGDYVEVNGTESPTGSNEILAALVERENLDPDTELQGFVQSVAPPNSFTILGVAISTSASTSFEDVNDAPLTSAQFFAQLGPGDLAKAKGVVVGTRTLQADEAELED